MLSTLHSTKSTFCQITLSEKFFEKIDVSTVVVITIPTKVVLVTQNFLHLLRAIGSMGKTLSSLLLSFETKDGVLDSKLNAKIVTSSNIVQNHQFWFETGQTHELLANRNEENNVVINSRNLLNWLSKFDKKLEEINLVFVPASFQTPITQTSSQFSMSSQQMCVLLKSYLAVQSTLYSTNSLKDSSKQLLTEVSLPINEFLNYRVHALTSLVFDFHDFKNIVGFAENLSSNLSISFSEPGKPLHVNIQVNESVGGEFLLSTLTPEHLGPSMPSVKRFRPKETEAEQKAYSQMDQNSNMFHYENIQNIDKFNHESSYSTVPAGNQESQPSQDELSIVENSQNPLSVQFPRLFDPGNLPIASQTTDIPDEPSYNPEYNSQDDVPDTPQSCLAYGLFDD